MRCSKSLGSTPLQTVNDRMLADQRETLALEGPMEIDGRFLTIGLHGSRMKDEANTGVGIVLVFEDLTELIKAQKWRRGKRWRGGWRTRLRTR